jgi:hypothetical protein
MWWQDTPLRLLVASATAGASRRGGRGGGHGPAAGQDLLGLLAAELASSAAGQEAGCALRRDWRGRRYLAARTPVGRRLRVYHASLAGRHALITSAGDVIGVADLASAARAVAAAARAGEG